ncbi:uncharacterized protein LOC128885313 [Hylaeus anthracinus]|uniref:uncharacterized protein LOC128885313 n=1 Tax=Hylaeus anthracinus TaxID=313031 RepID=UPI0023B9DC19|nr:uncharacterized protein LOC128885313 [Hylaeus anthracinus]
MRISERGWHAVYTVLCICVHSASQTIVYVTNSGFNVPVVNDPRQAFRATSSEQFSPESNYQRKLIPIKAPRVTQFVMLPLEPDAEMLPAHYTGVKPPGVDHMELKYAESKVPKNAPSIKPLKESDQRRATQQISTKNESPVEEGREILQRVISYEKRQKGDDQKYKKKTEYNESEGKRKTHTEQDNDSNHKEDQAKEKAGTVHENNRRDGVHRKALGFHNVYHKDEHKKDHDFYDNDDQGGHSKKHGRYNEKHVATEGSFKKGGKKGSSIDEAEHRKEETAKNSQAVRESKGREAGRGYDGFFKNFQGFAKQAGKNEGEKFGFVEAKAR